MDREQLAAKVAKRSGGAEKLEAIVHPLVRTAEESSALEARASGAGFAVLNTPLLFETGGDRRVDKVVVVTAPEMCRERGCSNDRT